MPPIFSISRIASTVLDVLFPASCRSCGADGAWLCDRCCRTIHPFARRSPVAGVDTLLTLGSYDIPMLQKAIHELKYAGGRVLCEPIASMMASVFKTTLKSEAIVPVPLHAARERERGFNQSAELSRALSARLGIRVADAVQRSRRTIPQVTLNEADRLRNVRAAFALKQELENVPKNGIVVDDVFTTGATISEVAGVLHSAGMEHIIALTIAKG